MTYNFFKLGSNYDSTCPVCRGRIDGYRKETACVYSTKQNGKYAYVVSHAECVGAVTKHAIGGGVKFRRNPAATLEVA